MTSELDLNSISSLDNTLKNLISALANEDIENAKFYITDNGTIFFVREGIETENGSAYVYVHGDGRWNEYGDELHNFIGTDRYNSFVQNIKNSSEDDTIIYCLNLNRPIKGPTGDSDSSEIIKLLENYNFESIAINGFSRGGSGAIQTAVDINKNTPGVANLIIMTAGSIDNSISDDEIQYLKGSTFVVCWDDNSELDKRWNSYKDWMTTYGIDMLSIKDPKGGHGKWLDETMGLDIVNFALGKNGFSKYSLNGDEFIFERCVLDENGNPVWQRITYEEFCGRVHVSEVNSAVNYLYSIKPIKCDNEILNAEITQVFSKINELDKINLDSIVIYPSTTNVPNLERTKALAYFKNVINESIKLKLKLNSIADYGNSMEELETKFTKEAEQLN